MDDPRYGTHGPESIPQVSLAPGVSVRVLAGPIPDLSSRRGPFATVQSVSIMDLSIAAGAVLDELSVPIEHDNVLLYCYRGSGVVSGVDVPFGHTIRLDASNPTVRAFSAQSGEQGMGLMLFSGTRLNQRIAWHGPIVMTTQNELEQAFRELRSGTFLKYRAPFDYRVASQAPSDWNWDSPNPIHMNR
jgi:redox-sensitive bicupin YhaK (pirin superfamily)